MSVGNEPTVTRRGVPTPRRGLPSWVRHSPDAEPVVTAMLRGLVPHGWAVLPGMRGPQDVPSTPAHVLVGPGGVVVVAARPRRGRAGATAAAAGDAAGTAAVVTSLLAPRHRSAVRAVVCVPDRTAPGAVGGAAVLRAADLGAHLRALPPRLVEADVAGLAQHLEQRLRGTRPIDVLTTDGLRPDGRVARRRAVRPLTSPDSASVYAMPDLPSPDLMTRALRAAVVVSTTWLLWVFTAAPLGFV